MAHNVTETPTFDATVLVPDEGDLITAFATGAGVGPVGEGMVSLADRTRYLKLRADEAQATLALMAGRVQRPYLRTDGVLSLAIGPFAAIVPDTTVANGYTLVSTSTETVLTNMNVEGGAGYVNSTWYFAFLALVAGTPTYYLSTTAPTAGRTKTGDANKIYLGSILINSAGNVIPMHAADGIYTWDEPQVAATGLVATTWTAESLSTAVPASATLASLLVVGSNSSAGTKTAFLRPKGSIVTTNAVLTVMGAAMSDPTPNYENGIGQWTGTIGVDSTQSVEYKSTANLSLALSVTGFVEP